MFQRANYTASSDTDWTKLKTPVATRKYDGGSYFMSVGPDGSLHYYSRRQSVHGHFPERSSQLPELTSKKLPHLAGNVYNVELIHTGKSKSNNESHRKTSGILNSLPEKAIATQSETGPMRAVLFDVISPSVNTYREKLLHLKEVEKAFGKPEVMFVPTPEITKAGIAKLIESTRLNDQEGVIVTDLDTPETSNKRLKIIHRVLHNLVISGMRQERDTEGNLKDSVGAFLVSDRSGREVGAVGSGLSREIRIDARKHPGKWLGKGIQVKSIGLGSPGGRLRAPVYNGESDGEIDLVE